MADDTRIVTRETLAAALRTDEVQDVIQRWMPTDQTSHVADAIFRALPSVPVDSGEKRPRLSIEARRLHERVCGDEDACSAGEWEMLAGQLLGAIDAHDEAHGESCDCEIATALEPLDTLLLGGTL